MNDIVEHIDDVVSGKLEEHIYYFFEPWDVEKRARWILDQAAKDNVDLYADWFAKHVPSDPHPFQSGFILSDAYFNGILAGTQVGKTYVALIKQLMMMTGEIPYAFRFNKGVNTGVKRKITDANVKRFGRRDSKTGEIIDFNAKAPRSQAWDEWDCGNIVGAGIFPEHMIAPPGEQSWIGTYMQTKDKTWWPRLYDRAKLMIPPHFIDRSRGNEGYIVDKGTVYLIRDQKLITVTYESGHERFESEMAWSINLDEEPEGAEGEKIVASAKTHGKFISFTLTPYQGVTFTKQMFFPSHPNPHYRIWHATRYDCPYLDRKTIEAQRVGEKSWQIAARVWGFHAEQTGRPYYDREKINIWIQKYRIDHTVAQMVPSNVFHSYGPVPGVDIKSVLDVSVMTRKAEFNRQDTWRIYEEPIKGVCYVVTADPAEGGETEEEASDNSSSIIMRQPIKERGESRPVICATLDSSLVTTSFARCVGMAARYYNNAMIAGETRRHASNAMFAGELKTWPYWFKMVVTSEATNKPKEVRGFDTTPKTRPQIFQLIGDWLAEADKDEYPGIPDEQLLVQLAGCVRGNAGRPDHTKGGRLDKAVCFGIGLYVMKYGADQLVYHGDPEAPARESKIRRLLQGEPVAQGGLRLPPWRGQ